MDVLLILHGSNLENTMKKLIISILFGLFVFSVFAETKYSPTGEYVGDFQIINVVCGSYLEDEEKAQMIGNKIGQYLRECIDIREEYNQEQKNLKALASKK